MKKSILSVIAGALGMGAGFGGSANTIAYSPAHHEPSKKQTRARASRRLFARHEPIIHTNSNAAARRLRQMQRGMLKPSSRNIHAHISQAIA